MKNPEKISLGQIYKSRKNPNFVIEIGGKKQAKWLGKVLTTKPGVYAGSHRLAEYTIRKHYELVK